MPSAETVSYTNIFQIIDNGLGETLHQLGKLEKAMDLLDSIFGPHSLKLIKENISEEQRKDFQRKIKKIKETVEKLDRKSANFSSAKPP